LMNNFKVKPTTGDNNVNPSPSGTVAVSDYDNVYLNGGEAISFK
jgi:hypothetical protein